MDEKVTSSRRDLLALAALVFLPALWVGVCVSKEKLVAAVGAAAGPRARGAIVAPERARDAREADPAAKDGRFEITLRPKLDAIVRAPGLR